ncbi:hypothetical protein [Methylovirgula sp. HY1]|uniref:hypothetical protein n=1 Tax=Methylovirgula sp. HY1 TaxID=2822761 RepID=UPI001C5BBCA3|nr:hypothetical protein [Methylovirgula sp. HY1]QXX75635.1 hypothetical protein MHY1_02465 [Methylovirgula sp. HY1]
MRVVLGIILGFFLTVGLAYVADTGRHAACPPTVAGRPLVNWDEVNLRLRNISSAVEAGWDRIRGRPAH